MLAWGQVGVAGCRWPLLFHMATRHMGILRAPTDKQNYVLKNEPVFVGRTPPAPPSDRLPSHRPRVRDNDGSLARVQWRVYNMQVHWLRKKYQAEVAQRKKEEDARMRDYRLAVEMRRTHLTRSRTILKAAREEQRKAAYEKWWREVKGPQLTRKREARWQQELIVEDLRMRTLDILAIECNEWIDKDNYMTKIDDKILTSLASVGSDLKDTMYRPILPGTYEEGKEWSGDGTKEPKEEPKPDIASSFRKAFPSFFGTNQKEVDPFTRAGLTNPFAKASDSREASHDRPSLSSILANSLAKKSDTQTKTSLPETKTDHGSPPTAFSTTNLGFEDLLSRLSKKSPDESDKNENHSKDTRHAEDEGAQGTEE